MRKSLSQEKNANEINSLKKLKYGFLIHTWCDKALKGTVVNQALTSLYRWTRKITPQLSNCSQIIIQCDHFFRVTWVTNTLIKHMSKKN